MDVLTGSKLRPKMDFSALFLQLLLVLPTVAIGVAVGSIFHKKPEAVDSVFRIKPGGEIAVPLQDGEVAPLMPDLGMDHNDREAVTSKSADVKYMERIVQSQWQKHRRWAKVASFRERIVMVGRISKLTLVATGAFLQVAATQLPGEYKSSASFLGGAFLAVATYIKDFFLTEEKVKGMVTSKTTSVALKAEVFKFRTMVGPYKDFSKDPDKVLLTFQQRCSEISKRGQDKKLRFVLPDSKPVPASLTTRDEYIERRLEKRINHFRKEAESKHARALFCQKVESSMLWLSTVCSIGQRIPGPLRKVVSFAGLESILSRMNGWSAAFVGVSTAFGSYLAKQKFEEISKTYGSAAERLNDALESWPATAKKAGDPDWENHIKMCENIMKYTVDQWANIKFDSLDKEPAVSASSTKTPKWDSKVIVGDDHTGFYPAKERVAWLMEHQNMEEEEAKKKVMEEYPEDF